MSSYTTTEHESKGEDGCDGGSATIQSQSFSLQNLFNMCDTNGDGVIGLSEFLELSTKFGISEEDSHAIFSDLDHDGDGHINFDDFAYGFNDFLTPGSRRGSLQINLVDGISATQQLIEMEKKHDAAQNAWKHFVTNIQPPSASSSSNGSKKADRDISGDPLREIIGSLRKEKSPDMSSKLETALTTLIYDMQSLQDEYKTLEKTFRKERETHAAQLAALGEELDSQLVKTELKAKAEARLEAQKQMEAERKKISEDMENKLGELSSQMKTYEKVEEWLIEEEFRDKKAKSDPNGTTKLIENENRSLKSALAEAQMKATVLQTQLAQKKNEYHDLYQELYSEKMAATEYKNQCDMMQSHLSVLSHANRVLSDANDCHFTAANSDSSSLPPRTSLYDEMKDSRNSSSGPPTNDFSDENLKLKSLQIQRQLLEQNSRSQQQQLQQQPVHSYLSSPDDIDSGRETLLDEIRAEGETSPLPSGTWSPASPSPTIARSALVSVSLTDDDSLATVAGLPSSIELNKALSSVKPEQSSSKELPGYNQTKHPLLQRTFKVILAGDAAVGKTSFIERACNGHFVSRLSSTIGVDFRVKNIEYNGHTVVLQLWDTAGQERFRSLTKSYFRRADGVILIYDVTNERTFVNIRHWIQNVEEGAGRKIPIVLCGNKIDLREELYRGVTCINTVEGEKLSKQCDAIFTEISPKTGHNVLETLFLLTQEMSSSEDAELRSSVKLEAVNQSNNKKSCCGGGSKTPSTSSSASSSLRR